MEISIVMSRMQTNSEGMFLPPNICLTSTFNSVNIWCKLHPRSREVSWFNSEFSTGIPLDRSFVFRNFVDSVSLCNIAPCFSDHDFVDLHFNLDDNVHHGLVWIRRKSLIVSIEAF